MHPLRRLIRKLINEAFDHLEDLTDRQKILARGMRGEDGPVDIIPPGTKMWFEYHCFESHESCDAELWYHSHQQVTVLDQTDHDAIVNLPKRQRMEDGQAVHYHIVFEDGFRDSAGEDELMNSPKEFVRPDPPKAPEEND